MNYNEYFNKRWNQYSYACMQYPNALLHEIKTAVHFLNIQSRDKILNIPGAYNPIHEMFPIQPKRYDCLETSEIFAKHACIPYSPWIPLSVNTNYTKIISLGSLHHLEKEKRIPFFKECLSHLSENGEFILGDVLAGSPQDAWLNTFVHSHNSLGHVGIFWSESDVSLFEEAGFSHVKTHIVSYPWEFNNKAALLDFTRNLFGIDAPLSDDELFAALQTYLNATETTIPWSLLYFKATKVSPTHVLSSMKNMDSHPQG